jgi:hypothetical protein
VTIVERALVAVVAIALLTAALTPPYDDVADKRGVMDVRAVLNRVAMVALAVTLVGWFL